MEVEFLVDKKAELEFRILDRDPVLAEILVNRLNDISDINFVAYKFEHPLNGYPRVIIKGKNLKKHVKSVLNSIIKDLESFKKEINK